MQTIKIIIYILIKGLLKRDTVKCQHIKAEKCTEIKISPSFILLEDSLNSESKSK